MGVKQIVTAALLLLVGVAIGYSLGKYGSYSNQSSAQPIIPSAQTEQAKHKTLLKSQTATIQGEITKVSGNTLSVKDDKGQTGDFPLSSKVVIYKFKAGTSQASASSDLNLIEIGKPILIVLEFIDGKYQVTQISYLPPTPSTPSR